VEGEFGRRYIMNGEIDIDGTAEEVDEGMPITEVVKPGFSCRGRKAVGQFLKLTN
jgi:hypothetical protein